MRYGSLTLVLLTAATLGGCDGGVLDPKGPIALAERQILFNATGIMLAIVIPVVMRRNPRRKCTAVVIDQKGCKQQE